MSDEVEDDSPTGTTSSGTSPTGTSSSSYPYQSVCHPSEILSRLEYLDRLFSLLLVGGPVSEKCWDLLMKLPSNGRIFRAFQELSDDSDPSLSWKSLLSLKKNKWGIYGLRYSLQIVESLSLDIPVLGDQSSRWRELFISHGGLTHLISILLEWNFSSAQQGQAGASTEWQWLQSLALVLKILHRFVNDLNRVAPSSTDESDESSILFKVLPAALLPKLLETVRSVAHLSSRARSLRPGLSALPIGSPAVNVISPAKHLPPLSIGIPAVQGDLVPIGPPVCAVGSGPAMNGSAVGMALLPTAEVGSGAAPIDLSRSAQMSQPKITSMFGPVKKPPSPSHATSELLHCVVDSCMDLAVTILRDRSPLSSLLFKFDGMGDWVTDVLLRCVDQNIRHVCRSHLHDICSFWLSSPKVDPRFHRFVLAHLLTLLRLSEPAKGKGDRVEEDVLAEDSEQARHVMELTHSLLKEFCEFTRDKPDHVALEDDSDQSPVSLDLDALFVRLLTRIRAHPRTESRAAATADPALCGEMRLVRVLCSFAPNSAHLIRTHQAVELVFWPLLFDIPTVENRGDRCPPCCKHEESRKIAFGLLGDLAMTSRENCRTLLELLSSQHTEPPLTDNGWYYDQDCLEKSKSGYVGLENLGATCYMNSLVQQLYMVPEFRYGIMSSPLPELPESNGIPEQPEATRAPESGNSETSGDNNGKMEVDQRQKSPEEQLEEIKSNSMLYQLQLILSNLQESTQRSYNARQFCQSYTDAEGGAMNVGVQMDVDEFFAVFFDKLEAALKGSEQDSLLNELFAGTLVNQLIGKECSHYSESPETFFKISLDIKNQSSISESLKLYVQGDMLEGDNKYYCEGCQQKRDALKRTCIKKLPQNLILHLKRFEFDLDVMRKVKLNDYCSFPDVLDMRPYTKAGLEEREGVHHRVQGGEEEDEEPLGSTIYKLVGVLVHSGTCDAGHYYSFIRERGSKEGPSRGSGGSEWYQFNDATVEAFDRNDMAKLCFGGSDVSQTFDQMVRRFMDVKSEKPYNAYMLFYERVPEMRPALRKPLPVGPPPILNGILRQNRSEETTPANAPKRRKLNNRGVSIVEPSSPSKVFPEMSMSPDPNLRGNIYSAGPKHLPRHLLPAEASNLVPDPVFRKIWERNTRLARAIHIFEPKYIAFVEEIVKRSGEFCEENQNYVDLPDSSLESCRVRLAFNFLVFTLSRVKIAAFVPRDCSFHTVFKSILNGSVPACRFVLRRLLDGGDDDNVKLLLGRGDGNNAKPLLGRGDDNAKRLLVDCVSARMRRIFADLVFHAMKCLKPFEDGFYEETGYLLPGSLLPPRPALDDFDTDVFARKRKSVDFNEECSDNGRPIAEILCLEERRQKRPKLDRKSPAETQKVVDLSLIGAQTTVAGQLGEPIEVVGQLEEPIEVVGQLDEPMAVDGQSVEPTAVADQTVEPTTESQKPSDNNMIASEPITYRRSLIASVITSYLRLLPEAHLLVRHLKQLLSLLWRFATLGPAEVRLLFEVGAVGTLVKFYTKYAPPESRNNKRPKLLPGHKLREKEAKKRYDSILGLLSYMVTSAPRRGMGEEVFGEMKVYRFVERDDPELPFRAARSHNSVQISPSDWDVFKSEKRLESMVEDHFNDDAIQSMLTHLSWDNSEYISTLTAVLSRVIATEYVPDIRKSLSITFAVLALNDSVHDERIRRFLTEILDVVHKNADYENEMVHSVKFLLRCVLNIAHVSEWLFRNPSVWVVNLLVAPLCARSQMQKVAEAMIAQNEKAIEHKSSEMTDESTSSSSSSRSSESSSSSREVTPEKSGKQEMDIDRADWLGAGQTTVAAENESVGVNAEGAGRVSDNATEGLVNTTPERNGVADQGGDAVTESTDAVVESSEVAADAVAEVDADAVVEVDAVADVDSSPAKSSSEESKDSSSSLPSSPGSSVTDASEAEQDESSESSSTSADSLDLSLAQLRGLRPALLTAMLAELPNLKEFAVRRSPDNKKTYKSARPQFCLVEFCAVLMELSGNSELKIECIEHWDSFAELISAVVEDERKHEYGQNMNKLAFLRLIFHLMEDCEEGQDAILSDVETVLRLVNCLLMLNTSQATVEYNEQTIPLIYSLALKCGQKHPEFIDEVCSKHTFKWSLFDLCPVYKLANSTTAILRFFRAVCEHNSEQSRQLRSTILSKLHDKYKMELFTSSPMVTINLMNILTANTGKPERYLRWWVHSDALTTLGEAVWGIISKQKRTKSCLPLHVAFLKLSKRVLDYMNQSDHSVLKESLFGRFTQNAFLGFAHQVVALGWRETTDECVELVKSIHNSFASNFAYAVESLNAFREECISAMVYSVDSHSRQRFSRESFISGCKRMATVKQMPPRSNRPILFYELFETTIKSLFATQTRPQLPEHQAQLDGLKENVAVTAFYLWGSVAAQRPLPQKLRALCSYLFRLTFTDASGCGGSFNTFLASVRIIRFEQFLLANDTIRAIVQKSGRKLLETVNFSRDEILRVIEPLIDAVFRDLQIAGAACGKIAERSIALAAMAQSKDILMSQSNDITVPQSPLKNVVMSQSNDTTVPQSPLKNVVMSQSNDIVMAQSNDIVMPQSNDIVMPQSKSKDMMVLSQSNNILIPQLNEVSVSNVAPITNHVTSPAVDMDLCSVGAVGKQEMTDGVTAQELSSPAIAPIIVGQTGILPSSTCNGVGPSSQSTVAPTQSPRDTVIPAVDSSVSTASSKVSPTPDISYILPGLNVCKVAELQKMSGLLSESLQKIVLRVYAMMCCLSPNILVKMELASVVVQKLSEIIELGSSMKKLQNSDQLNTIVIPQQFGDCLKELLRLVDELQPPRSHEMVGIEMNGQNSGSLNQGPQNQGPQNPRTHNLGSGNRKLEAQGCVESDSGDSTTMEDRESGSDPRLIRRASPESDPNTPVLDYSLDTRAEVPGVVAGRIVQDIRESPEIYGPKLPPLSPPPHRI
eukprot:367144_1